VNFPEPIAIAIAHLQQWFRERLREGVVCMVCGRHAKIRPRTIRRAQAMALVHLVYLFERGQAWTHTRDLGPQGTKGFSCPDFPTLKHWGLLVPMPGLTDPKKKTSGYWGPSALALDWVKGRTTLPRHVDLLHDAVTGVSDEDRVTIQEAMEESFDYADFLARTSPREPALPDGGESHT
jgi:hypothetical protein